MMATDSPAAMSNETSFTMVSIPSGLVTFFVRFSALSTLIRFVQLVLILALVPLARAADPAQPAIVVLGDSLSAGYGIKVQQGWVNLLAQRLARHNEALAQPLRGRRRVRLPHRLDQELDNLLARLEIEARQALAEESFQICRGVAERQRVERPGLVAGRNLQAARRRTRRGLRPRAADGRTARGPLRHRAPLF